MSGAVELRACPFCSGKPEWATEFGGNRRARLVHCANPECLGHHHEQDEQGGYNHDFSDTVEAIAAWNRRADDAERDTLLAQLKKIRSALEQIASSLDVESYPENGSLESMLGKIARAALTKEIK